MLERVCERVCEHVCEWMCLRVRALSKHLDGEGAFGSVCLQVDLHGGGLPASCDQTVTQLLQSITAVGDEFTDEHLSEGQQRPLAVTASP